MDLVWCSLLTRMMVSSTHMVLFPFVQLSPLLLMLIVWNYSRLNSGLWLMPSLICLLSLVLRWLDPAHFKRDYFTFTIPRPLVTNVDIRLHLDQQTGSEFEKKEAWPGRESSGNRKKRDWRNDKIASTSSGYSGRILAGRTCGNSFLFLCFWPRADVWALALSAYVPCCSVLVLHTVVCLRYPR